LQDSTKFLSAGSIFLFKQEKRKWIFPLAFAILLSAIVSFAIKTLIGRLRPFQEGLVSVLRFLFYFMKESVNTWNYSFPSFQAMLVFSVYPIICKEFNKFKYIWFIFACLIAFSRVYFGVHYMSDILVGAVVGYFIGLFAVWVEEQTGFGIKLAKKIKLIVD